MARFGGGKSGGFRKIILLRRGSRAFFVHDFAKNERDNFSAVELEGFKKLAADWLGQPNRIIEAAVENGKLVEVPDHDEED